MVPLAWYMPSVGAYICGSPSGGTATAPPSPTAPWPRTSGTPKRGVRRRAWCTVLAAPTSSTKPPC